MAYNTDLKCIDNIIEDYVKEAIQDLQNDEVVAAIKPKRTGKNKDSKTEYEEVMISIKDCMKLVIPVVQNISKSNKEIIERQNAKQLELMEKIDKLENKC